MTSESHRKDLAIWIANGWMLAGGRLSDSYGANEGEVRKEGGNE